MKRLIKTLIAIVLCAALIAGGIVFGPRLYRLLAGNTNATWISERLSETLLEKRELVVLEKTITGTETVSTDAWLIGTVRKVEIPYTFSVNFSVDLQQADVEYDETDNVVRITLPQPSADYYKLTVDEDNVKTQGIFLQSKRGYSKMKEELEERLYEEVTADTQLQESAWASAVSETEALYQELLDANGETASFTVEVVAKQTQATE